MAMRLITAIEKASGAAERWRTQYADWRPEDTFSDGTAKADHDAALNSAPHTPEHIAKAINPGWAYPSCDGCGGLFKAVVQVKEPWVDDGEQFCANCLSSAMSLILQVQGAEAEVPRK